MGLFIAYITASDSSDIHTWSGLNFYIAEALKRQDGVSLSYIDKLKFELSLSARLKTKLFLKYSKKRFHIEREVSLLKNYAKEITNRLDPSVEVLFSSSSLPMSFLKTDKLKVFYTDATFASMIDYYGNFTNLSKYAIRQGNKIEKRALENCDLAIYSSDWAARSAISDYNIDPKKVKVVPFGANINCFRTVLDIEQIIDTKSKEVCNLLFVGVDWKRKGGELALEVATKLYDMGLPVHLDIVGIKENLSLPVFAQNHGFISKSTPEGISRIETLMSKAHFLILPTKAECSAIVFCEASSFGLPSITTKTGGVTTLVKDNLNGKTFDLSASSDEYVDFIIQLFTNSNEYKELCLSSFHEYENRLNWNVAGGKIVKLINEIIYYNSQPQ